ncbi:MAG: Dna2/Cas4 domain-containing protein [Candidatus Hydrothermarchaeales archaeon]
MDKMNVGVGSISKLIVGEENCLYKIWYGMRHKEEVEEVSKELVKWKINHTNMLTNLSQSLDGGVIRKEDWIKLDVLGGILIGKMDLLHIKDNEITVYDCKSGKPKEFHQLQIMIYLYMMDELDLYSDQELKGVLYYGRDEISYSLKDIPNDLPQLIERYANILLSEEPPRPIGGSSCKWCKIECETKET